MGCSGVQLEDIISFQCFICSSVNIKTPIKMFPVMVDVCVRDTVLVKWGFHEMGQLELVTIVEIGNNILFLRL